jgi:ABC-2 type transport system permease protein
MVKQRDGYHQKWDLDQKITLDKFYGHYPQFQKYGIPTETFTWLWYYAMQQMGDDESLSESNAMRNKILQREKTSSMIARVIPTLHAQMQFNDIAHTSLTDYIMLLDSAGSFHEKKRLYFYPKIFENADVKREDWTTFKPEYLSSRKDILWGAVTIPLIIMTLLLFTWAWMRSRSLFME